MQCLAQFCQTCRGILKSLSVVLKVILKIFVWRNCLRWNLCSPGPWVATGVYTSAASVFILTSSGSRESLVLKIIQINFFLFVKNSDLYNLGPLVVFNKGLFAESWQLSKYLCFYLFSNYKEFVALPIEVFYKLSISGCQIFNRKTTQELELFSKWITEWSKALYWIR